MKSDWFKWLSADDLLKENAVEILYEETKNLGIKSKFNILYSDYDIINELGEKIDEYHEPNYNDLEPFQRNVILLDHFYGNGNTTLIHKSVFEKCGKFNENIKFKDDYEFWLRCCLIFGYKLHLVPHSLASYRIHKNQLTKKKFTDALEQIKDIKDLVLSNLPDDLRKKYLLELHNYQKKKPLNIKTRRMMRDFMFKTFPKKLSNKILEKYLNNKEY
jgi:hypothetical protein